MQDHKPGRSDLVKAAVNNSPYYRHLNMRLVQLNPGGSVMEMEVIPGHKNVWATVHGGALAGLADSACGTAVSLLLAPGESVVTLDLKIQFFMPVKQGKLVARGRVVHRSRRFVHTECELFDAGDNLVARGGAIHAVLVDKA